MPEEEVGGWGVDISALEVCSAMIRSKFSVVDRMGSRVGYPSNQGPLVRGFTLHAVHLTVRAFVRCVEISEENEWPLYHGRLAIFRIWTK